MILQRQKDAWKWKGVLPRGEFTKGDDRSGGAIILAERQMEILVVNLTSKKKRYWQTRFAILDRKRPIPFVRVGGRVYAVVLPIAGRGTAS